MHKPGLCTLVYAHFWDRVQKLQKPSTECHQAGDHRTPPTSRATLVILLHPYCHWCCGSFMHKAALPPSSLVFTSRSCVVQMIEVPIFFLVLCLYRSNGCAARGPAGFVRSALARRIFVSDGNVDATSNTREKPRKASEKYPHSHHLHHSMLL